MKNDSPQAQQAYDRRVEYVRADLPRAAADDVPLCPKCQQEYVCEHCGDLLSTPRAETGLSVEAALKELREMFPTFHCRITFCEDVHNDPSERSYCNIEWD
jgi:hypothetical protein